MDATGYSTLCYTTRTGDQPRPTPIMVPGISHPAADVDADPHCFVCSRHTDHAGEHDDQVERGEAFYGRDGSVYTAAQWHAWANPALHVAA